ncbi:hypothetical protein [Candidatus Poriferisocius sp.]|uniref:hypothetical protein n=1 Tax=Candidatus Poriferisocius sp. TaxID=3101276 RepID=UPI003B029AD2
MIDDPDSITHQLAAAIKAAMQKPEERQAPKPGASERSNQAAMQKSEERQA